MKRFFTTGLLALAVTQLATAQISSTFDNQAGTTYQIPPNLLTIDATNFVNAGMFIVNTPLDLNSFDNIYFSTSDTLNYTNTGVMTGTPGFDFGFYPTYYIRPQPGVPFNKMAASFANLANGFGGGLITSAPASTTIAGLGLVFGLGGATQVRVAATNLVNSGIITIDNSTVLAAIFLGGLGNVVGLGGTVPPALISLKGENVDLSGGTLAFSSSQNFTNSTFGVSSLDSGVGTDTNADWDPSFDLLGGLGQNVAVSSFFSTRLFPAPFVQQLALFNSVPYAENTTGTPVGTNILVWRSIFLQDTSPPNVTKNVYFDGSTVGNGAFHVEWGGTFLDPLTHLITTNYLYLSDVPGDLTATTVTNVFFIQNGVPLNYSFTESSTRLLNPTNAATSSLPTIIPAGVVSNLYSYLSLQLIPTLSSTNNIFGGSITNLPERIEISASRTLNLTGTQIAGPDYVSLRSTNQFDGNVGASLDAPFLDMSLGVTNGSLSISNLIRPLLPRWSGTIQAFTARWFVTDANGITNDYRVLLVNSQVFPTSVPQIQDLILHATNSLTLSDALNVTRKLLIDAATLVLTTNDSSALASSGGLNIMNSDILWSGAMPNLKYLTNSGVITAGNLINFAGNMSSPYSNPNAAIPYQAFVNYGAVTNLGSFIVANHFENHGVFQNNPNGNFTLRAKCADLSDGFVFAATNAGNISIACNSLVVSNASLQSGATLSISVTNCITDGYSLFNQFGHVTTNTTPYDGGVTNGNMWTAGGSFNMPVKPTTGDLLGTTVSNAATRPQLSVWAGEDRGCTPAGFVNNLAIGRLVLDGRTPAARFNFAGTGPAKALYVDRLELYGTATNLGPAGLTNINLGSNMRIYYAQAIANGVSIAEKLQTSLRNNGRFCWVSNYAGVFSSTNITYPSFVTYTFNEALVESANIDSDNDGQVNRDDSSPIPLNWVFDLVVTNPPCDCDEALVGFGLGGILHSGHPGSSDPTILRYPGQLDSAGSTATNLFTLTQGTYNGLFYDTNGVSAASAGYFRASVMKNGKLSGNLRLAGKTYPFSGYFDATGHLVRTNLHPARDNRSIRLNLDAQLDLAGGGKVNGAVTGSHWTAMLLADRMTHTAIQSKYTFVIPGDRADSADSPAGHGYGTVIVKPDGTLQWGGALGDGYSVPQWQLSGVSSQGVWPLYSTPYSGAGLVLGWIQFDPAQPDSDLHGETIWIKPGGLTGSNAKLYPGGFTNQIEVVGSAYLQPTAAPGNGAVVLTGGNLATETNHFALKSNFKASTPGGNYFSLGLDRISGVFKGQEKTIFNPRTQFQGVWLQKMGAGYGFFLGTNRSGQVWYVPLP